MANYTLRETTIGSQFKFMVEEALPNVKNSLGQEVRVLISDVPNPDTQTCEAFDLFGSIFVALSSIMSNDNFKTKEKSAFVITDKKNNNEFILACTADYDEDGDNYFYNCTFDSEDISGINKKNVYSWFDYVDSRNATFFNLVDANLEHSHAISIIDSKVSEIITICAIKCLYNWLDTQAVEGEVVTLDITDALGNFESPISSEDYKNKLITLATASVEVVKGIKKMSIQFGEELKAIAKGNGDLPK